MSSLFRIVSADHVIPKYRLDKVRVEIRESNHGPHGVLYYVSIPGFGCSKDYRKPNDSIYAMLTDHACTRVIVQNEEQR